MGAILALIAVVIFAVATFGGEIGSINLVPAGLMFLAGAHVVGGWMPSWPARRRAE